MREASSWKDFGCHSTESVDYPFYAKEVCRAIQEGVCDQGILICGTGIGISITREQTERDPRGAVYRLFMAEATRQHNDANILALGGRVVGPGLACKIVDTFLDTPFSGDERHVRRIRMMEED